MSNRTFRGFPRRRDEPYRRRAFNLDDAPRYSDLAVWYDLQHTELVFADTAKTTPCAQGGAIAAIHDSGPHGFHLSQATAGNQPTYTVDNGFWASTGTSNTRYLDTLAAVNVAHGVMFAVFRAPNTGWDTYGAPLGRAIDYRPYMFNASGGTFNTAFATTMRKNGNALTNATATSLSPINVPMVLVGDWQGAAVGGNLRLSGHAGFVSNLIIYEVLLYTSLLPLADIQDIEAMLMAKYSIV